MSWSTVHRRVNHWSDIETGGAGPSSVYPWSFDALEANSPLWQLRVNCLHYCRFVHSHHNLEDIAIFPILREANPALGPVVDRLEGDHKVVSGQLDEVEEAASLLVSDESQVTRERLVNGLEALAVTLLEHLQFEEEEAGPTIRRLARIG